MRKYDLHFPVEMNKVSEKTKRKAYLKAMLEKYKKGDATFSDFDTNIVRDLEKQIKEISGF